MGLKNFDDLDLSGAKVLKTLVPSVAPPAAAPAPPGTFTLEIPDWRPATLNEIFKRGNHYSAARLKRGDRHAVIIAAVRAGIPPATRKRRVSLTITLAGRMKQCDPDSFHKSTLDALVAARLLVDDSPDFVELGPVVQVGGDVKATVITLEDLAAEEPAP